MKPGPDRRDLDARLRAHFAAGSAPIPDDVVATARARIVRHERTIRQRLVLLVVAFGAVAVGLVGAMSGTLNLGPAPKVTATPSALATASVGPTERPTTELPGTWRSMAAAPIPGRYGSSGVWTGSEFIVWGGRTGSISGSTPDPADPAIGAAYNPATDAWRRISPGPLGQRDSQAAVWTGQEMLVWGGNPDRRNPEPTATGAAYDPVTDTWRPITAAPVAGYSAVWTGDELIALGATGGLAAFDPRLNRWRALPDPSTEPGHVQYIVWTGSELLVFVAPDGIDSAVRGYRLDPASGASRGLAASPWWALYAAPAIWAGDQVISLGQYPERSSSGLTNSVAYDPAVDRWRSIGTCEAGVAHAVWTGTYVLGDHSAYDVARDKCLRLPTPPDRPGRPTTGRAESAFAWTGREYLIWSGGDGSDALVLNPDGVIFTPTGS